MSTLPPSLPCPGCAARDQQIATLQQQVQQMQQQLAALQETVARLQKNSSNSSKPPSSDIVQPPKPAPKKGKKRQRGGQPGHSKYERTFHLSDADVRHDYRLDYWFSAPRIRGVVHGEKVRRWEWVLLEPST
jgi:hypothetical protein